MSYAASCEQINVPASLWLPHTPCNLFSVSAMVTDFKWTEHNISRAIAFQFFKRSTVIVPRCHWAGSEADLLVVHKDLRLTDIEIKISRADLKADYGKDKWIDNPIRYWSRRNTPVATPLVKRQWPAKVWKHYYALPSEIWDDSLFTHLPPASGVLLLRKDGRYDNGIAIWPKRHARPNRDAKPISAADAIDIARLANLRMWAALSKES